MLLNKIDSPADIKFFNSKALDTLCAELREMIIKTVFQNGGHLGSSLGVVELTVALHYVFDTPLDKIVWDIGHQAYSHKILTGRRDRFATLRQEKGVAPFVKRAESIYDNFGAGHSSTSISAAFGMEIAKTMHDQSHHVIAVIGDGALTAGMAYEAINNAGSINNQLIVVLNDNGMSIAPTTGKLKTYLSKKSGSKWFTKFLPKKQKYELFESLGFDCIGPLDGHNIQNLISEFNKIKTNKNRSKPILIHILTEKSKGGPLSLSENEKFHSLNAPSRKLQRPTYTEIFAESLIREASLDTRIVAITAAMPSGTGLNVFQKKFPKRFFDVGIAEQHAVTFAAGLACEGISPFVAIYSTFLQRSFDQIIHDVALQKLPVRFAIDRAGLVGADGATHVGAFDIAFLGIIPNFVIMCPSDATELSNMVHTAANYHEGPIAFRYPRDRAVCLSGTIPQVLEIGRGRIVKQGNEVALLVLGTRLKEAIKASKILQKKHNLSITVADARFAKPIDTGLILQLLKNHRALITIEDGSIGGFSAYVNNFILKHGLYHDKCIKNLFLPDVFIEHGNASVLYGKYLDLNSTAMIEIIKQILNISNITLLHERLGQYADVASGVEQLFRKQLVGGSTPSIGTIFGLDFIGLVGIASIINFQIQIIASTTLLARGLRLRS